MSFKKNGTDPMFDRKPSLPGLPGGPSWASWIENVSRAVQEFIAAAAGMKQGAGYTRYSRSKRPQQKRKKHRNMVLVSKRVRRKHRRAA